MTPTKHRVDYLLDQQKRATSSKRKSNKSNACNDSDSPSDQENAIDNDFTVAPKDFSINDVAGSEIYQFSTPKKSDGMKRKAENTPKTPATALSRLSLNSPKTPRTLATTLALRAQSLATPTETRNQNKKALSKKQQEESELESSADEHSDYEAKESSDSTSDEENSDASATASDDDDFEEPKPLANKRNVIVKQKTVELPTRTGTRGRPKKPSNNEDFIPDSDNYFLTAANKKVNLN